MPSIFFAYAASSRSHVETIRYAAKKIEERSKASTVLWQDMVVDGQLVIDRVFAAISEADMCIFDLTDQSENVLFEAGYAVAHGKPVWLTLDVTRGATKTAWKELALLNPLGYTAYHNSSEFAEIFCAQNPLETLPPAYDQLIEPLLPEDPHRDSILYCATFEPFEASNRLSTFLSGQLQRGLRMRISDPTESALDPITWLAPAVMESAGVLVHLAGRQRNRSSLHNRRHAFVAGMARGFEVPLLMLAEENYLTPFDYQTLLRKHETAEECVRIAKEWIEGISAEKIGWKAPRSSLRSALSSLRFGQHVAENELLELGDYFVETAAFGDVIAARDTIFVGQRGTGKTANATQAFERIAANKTNMAVLIKPPGFEFPALFAVIKRLPEFQHDYFFDALWRFVIQTEIAASVLTRIEERMAGIPLQPAEKEFVAYADAVPFDVRADMSVRLEQALDSLIDSIGSTEASANKSRNLINEAFHAEALVKLRHRLGPVLKDRRRVAIFVDNLDKGWQRGADFKLVARLILGLLTARGGLVRDFEKQDYWRDRIRLTVSIFLRSDIYEYLRREAREPDKLPITTIEWRDPKTLLAVLENRFLESAIHANNASELWTKYFCDHVGTESTKDFIASVVLSRPRDIVYFCNTAVGRAVDRRNDRVQAEDFRAAEEIYSQYAYEGLLVENGVTIPEMEDALFGFLGSSETLTGAEIFAALKGVGLDTKRQADLFTKLISVSFLGIEVKQEEFIFPQVGVGLTRAWKLAAILQPEEAKQRFKIHRAFHSFLGVETVS
jgi:hypothetical protein